MLLCSAAFDILRPLQVFVSHLHSDHIADLASLYIGAMFGRRCVMLPTTLTRTDSQLDNVPLSNGVDIVLPEA